MTSHNEGESEANLQEINRTKTQKTDEENDDA